MANGFTIFSNDDEWHVIYRLLMKSNTPSKNVISIFIYFRDKSFSIDKFHHHFWSIIAVPALPIIRNMGGDDVWHEIASRSTHNTIPSVAMRCAERTQKLVLFINLNFFIVWEIVLWALETLIFFVVVSIRNDWTKIFSSFLYNLHNFFLFSRFKCAADIIENQLSVLKETNCQCPFFLFVLSLDQFILQDQ